MNSPYCETLGEAVDKGITSLKECGAEFVNEQDLREQFMSGGICYGMSKKAHARLSTYKGKNTRKFAFLSIYRMESGRYEMTAYVL